MKMTLAVDHRIVNGAEAAQFLSFVVDLLGEPEKLQ
jgi:pyruvate/2-oxoglutarate dehydrogenase complex dihydrolipoamide acyltransferase (E2) component